MRRLFLLLISISLCLISSFELLRRYQEQRFLILQTEPLNSADTLLTQKRWQEAKYLAHVVKDQPELGDKQRAQSIEIASEAALDSFSIQSEAFMHGLVSGEANNGASLLGAMTLDLFVIGDIRDLLVQGYREITYQEGDKVILALSATGLSLALLPGVHWAPALMKGLKRTGALSESFVKILYKHSRTALESGDFRPLAKVVNDFGQATKNLGPGPVSGAMKAVQTEAELTKLASASAIDPRRSYAITALAGQRGLKQVDKSGGNVATIAQKLKVSSRLAKTAKKSLGALPTAYILIAFLLGSLLTVKSVLPLRQKHPLKTA